MKTQPKDIPTDIWEITRRTEGGYETLVDQQPEDAIRGINFAITFTLNTIKATDDEFLQKCLIDAARMMRTVSKRSDIPHDLLDVDFYLVGKDENPWEPPLLTKGYGKLNVKTLEIT